MTVQVGIETESAGVDVLSDVLEVLTVHNLALYAAGVVTAPPWGLQWRPDALLACDASGCVRARVCVLPDVALCFKRGGGSCGPLASAYAAWLRARGVADARVDLVPTPTPGAWHAYATSSRGNFDPMEYGRQQR